MSDEAVETVVDQTLPSQDVVKLGRGELTVVDGSIPRAMFLPANFGEAMRLAEIMATSNSVPPHLRKKPGDCLAVVMLSVRVGADPYAIANKSYFVNDRMAYESQLVAALVNTSNLLDGRLSIEWYGAGEELRCCVTGRIKGDPKPKPVEQDLKTITTRNSPLWKQAPRQQIAYYTQRLWGRLYMPEALLGIYAVDEIEAQPGAPAPVVPSRSSLTASGAQKLGEYLEEGRPPAIFTDAPEDGDGRLPTEDAEDAVVEEVVDTETGEVTAAEDQTGGAFTGEQAQAEQQVDQQAEQAKPAEEEQQPETVGNVPVPTNDDEWQVYADGLVSMTKTSNDAGLLKKLENKHRDVWKWGPELIRAEIEAAFETRRQTFAANGTKK